MDEIIAKLKELKEKSTPVSLWYAHGRNDQCAGDEATVRGPYGRWFVVSGGKGYEQNVGGVADDAKYAAESMNMVPVLIAEIERLRNEIGKAYGLERPETMTSPSGSFPK